jgi:hypothetical protein
VTQVLRYIRFANSFGRELSGLETKHKPMFQFSIFGLILFFYAIISLGFFFVTTTDPTVKNFAQTYLVLTAVSAGTLPILAGKNWSKLGPVFREYQWGKLIKRHTLPKYAMWMLGIGGGFGSIVLIDNVLTYGGFTPHLDFFGNLTPQLLYGQGAIVEEFYFRIFPYKVLERIAPSAFTNIPFFLGVVAPADSVLFTGYHLLVYGGNNLALSIVFGAGYSQNVNFRGLKLDWVIMLVHMIINMWAPPQLIVRL